MFNLITINRVILIINLIRPSYSMTLDKDDGLKPNANSQLEVRAVMIKCKISETVNNNIQTDTTRFQREELFKHNALHDCKQKLTLTVKACSEPGQDSGDEYIPIEHVLGANRKRIRLLHPYVLRLRRQLPFQVYKLRKIDTVTGFIGMPPDKWVVSSSNKRLQRDVKPFSEGWSVLGSRSGPTLALDHDNNKNSFSIRIRERKKSRKTKAKMKLSNDNFNTCDETNIWHQTNESSLLKRKTRLKRKIKKYVKEFADTRTANEIADNNLENDKNIGDEYENFSHKKMNNLQMQQKIVQPIQITDAKETETLRRHHSATSFDSSDREAEEAATSEITKIENIEDIKIVKDEEKHYALYEIGDPDLWYNAQVQLFEKLSTPEGKTVWKDLTKDEEASVSSIHPEWSNQDLNVHYKPIDWLPQKEFTLPQKSLCLVVPLKVDSDNPVFDRRGDYIIVPFEDIIPMNDVRDLNKKDKKSDNSTDSSTEGSKVGQRRRVVVRAARALMGGCAGNLKIITRGKEHYLKLPHTRPYHAQIDIEGKADDNQLVLVGALGRLTTIVSDTTRKSRSILTVQATNTGLAAARFRVVTRECTPELLNEEEGRSKKAVAGPMLLPPRHSGTFRLNLQLENAIDCANCVVSLVNQDDESVAIRDVRIKRDDRCFCVWHCDCVCLSEDPKLLCRSLTEAQIAAAGLSTGDRSRHARSVCYPDVVTLNLFVTFIGVLLALLLLGIIKAFLGLLLRCVGSCGLHFLLTPRKLDRYYESSLRCRPVVYDDNGWPVHPDTKQPTVRLVSIPVEFVLNLIFFITLPCLMIWEAVRKLVLRLNAKKGSANKCSRRDDIRKCYSTQDAQSGKARYRRRRNVLHRWMTPQAEQLSTDVWSEGLTPPGITASDCALLHDNTRRFKNEDHSMCSDSDQEDTEYVLMQMQKSRESLAKCQQNLVDEKTASPWNKNVVNGNKK